MASNQTNIRALSGPNNRVMPSLSNTADVAQWLHNKLSTDDNWSDKSSIVSQLNIDILRNIKTCFAELQSNVKLKLLLSFLHISRKNLDEWKDELEVIIGIAISDSDQWVKVVGQLLKNYPSEGVINFAASALKNADTKEETKLLIKLAKLCPKILPLECLFLNRNAFQSSFGQIPQPEQHFKLKRKAKSAALRAELLQKATDLSSGKRSSTGTTVPIRCRGVNSSDSAPLKGIPSRNHFSSYSSFNKSSTLSRLSSTPNSSQTSRAARLASVTSGGSGVKRDGGIVLLDINEAPSANQRDLKRQRKQEKTTTPATTAVTTPTTPSTVVSNASTLTTTTSSKSNIVSSPINDQESETPTATPNQDYLASNPSSTATNTSRVSKQQNNVFSDGLQQTNNDQSQQQPKNVLQPPSALIKNKLDILSENDQNDAWTAAVAVSEPKNSEMPTTTLASNNKIFAFKSTPDYAAGLVGASNSAPLSMNDSSPSKLSQSLMNPSGEVGDHLNQQPQTSSMYYNSIQQQQQTTPKPQQQQTTVASSSMYSSSTTNTFNSSLLNSNQNQQQHSITANYGPLNSSFQAQQQAPNRNVNFGFPQQQSFNNNQTLSPQKSNQQQSSPEYLVQNQQQQQSSSEYLLQNQQPQSSRQTVLQNLNPRPGFTANNSQDNSSGQAQYQAPSGMYGPVPNLSQQPMMNLLGSTNDNMNNSPSMQQPSLVSAAQPRTHTQSADDLLRDINIKFPKLDEKVKSTIQDFLKGGPNPQPELGPTREIRLGETIELRQSKNGIPYRVLVETKLQIDYDEKTCKKLENFNQFQLPSQPAQQQQSPHPNTVLRHATMLAQPRAHQPFIQLRAMNNDPRAVVQGPMILNIRNQTSGGVASTFNYALRPGVRFITMTPSGQIRPIDPITFQQQQQQQQQAQSGSQQSANQQQPIQYGHVQQRA